MSNSSKASTHLTTAECWTLLENAQVGRLAVIGEDGAPDIFPVNFVSHEGAVYIRSAPDAKVVRLVARPAAAFEVDGHDALGWWSVVLRGTATRIKDPVEIEQSGVSRLVTASPRYKQHVLKLTPTTVAGRRFADPEQAADSAPPAGSSSTPVSPAEADQNHRRGQRPASIPSQRPWSDGASFTAPMASSEPTR